MDNNAGAPKPSRRIRPRCILRRPRRSRGRGRYSPAVQPDQALELPAFPQYNHPLRVRLRALLRDPIPHLDEINELLDVIGKAVGISDSCSDNS